MLVVDTINWLVALVAKLHMSHQFFLRIITLCGIVYWITKTFNHEKSLMFKYGRMQKKISLWLVCGSHGACLDCMLPGVQVTAGLRFFLCSSHLCDNEDLACNYYYKSISISVRSGTSFIHSNHYGLFITTCQQTFTEGVFYRLAY